MTKSFPDVSSYQRGLRIQPGTVAVVAKATQGVEYEDPTFHDFMDQAAAVGAVRSGYHFLEAGNGAAQADFCADFVGELIGQVSMMIDCEPTGNSRPTTADCEAFIERDAARGGRVWGVYFPHWYWSQIGGDLRPLRDRGACLVSSAYTGYTDNPTGTGWQPYGSPDGSLAPTVWQYTDRQAYGGQLVDFNAFRGSTSDLKLLIEGDENMTPHDFWAFRGNNGDGQGPDAPDVHQSLLTTRDNTNQMRTELSQVQTDLAAVTALLAKVAAKVGA
jgi:hypothetical protein